jgi:nucleoside-diphosphate-sugar epimerase
MFSRQPSIPPRPAGRDVSLFPGDLNDPDTVLNAMTGMEVFYHIGELRNTSARAAEANVRLVGRIIGHFRSGANKFVFISSLNAAGIPFSTPATEETIPRFMPDDHYTRYKLPCEQALARELSKNKYVVLRPGVVYGSGSRYSGGYYYSAQKNQTESR